MSSRVHRPLSVTIAVVIAASLAIAGCGSEATPTAASLPAAASSASFGTQSTSAIAGQLISGGGSLGSESPGSAPAAGSTAGMQVSIDGTGISARTSSDGRFLLNGVPDGNLVLHIVGNGANATLMLQGVSANQLIQVTIQVAGTSAQLVAEDRDELDEFEGTVTAVQPSPSSFTLDDGSAIFTDGGTWWDTGGDLFSFEELADAFGDGLIVRAEGRVMLAPDGRLLASVVKAEADEPVEEPAIEELRLELDPDTWSLGWVGNGSSGSGNSAVVAEIDHGPFADILGSSVEMEGPDGIVVPFDTGVHGEDFEARFTKAQAIGIAASVAAGGEAEIFVRGTLLDGTAWELSASVRIVADDDDDADDVADDDGDDDADDDEDDDEQLDPAVAAQAIVDINAVIADIDTLVGLGELASNNATPLISKLQAAIGSLQRLDREPAVNQLEAFLKQLDTFEKTDRISEDAAEVLEEDVEDILDAIED